MKFVQGVAFPDADQLMADQMRPDGTYQGDHLAEALARVTDFSCAIDGGAHVGLWSRTMAAVFGRVLAFEPSTDTFECLALNLQPFSQVHCHQLALGDAPGHVSMAWTVDCAARKNTGGRYVCQGGDVQVITIDSLQLESLGFLKLDVEGSEPMALAGAAETIDRCRPVILFEAKLMWTKHFGLAKHAVTDILTAHHYRRLQVVGADEIWGPR